jgi:cytochrome c5
MGRPALFLAVALLAAAPACGSAAQALKPPSAFAGIADRNARSAAIFGEMGKVISSPRCMNCHPSERRPTQEDGRPHVPAVAGGPDGRGVPGLPCTACHQAANTPVAGGGAIRSVPGHPKWALAPAEMAWQGRSLAEICRQLKDPGRNGRRSLEQLWRHMAFDDLVGWGWAPGDGRTPAPGSQQQFGALARAWADSGGACPP